MHRRRQLLREPSRHLRKAFSSKAKKPSERNARCAGAKVPRKSVTTVTSTSSRISAAAVAAAESPLLPVRRHLSSFTEKKAWLPESEYELQNMTRQAMVYQLNLVQNNVANGLVHWFTTNMPAAYFRQVDKDTQMAHLRSLSAQWDHSNNKFMRAGGGEAFKGSNRIVLQSATSDGNLEVAYMDFSGNQKGLLAGHFEELKWTASIGSLVKTKVFTSIDERLCFNIFTFAVHEPYSENNGMPFTITPMPPPPMSELQQFATASREAAAGGHHKPAEEEAAAAAGLQNHPERYAERIFAYAEELRAAHDAGVEHPDAIAWRPLFSLDRLREYVRLCPRAYVEFVGPRSFLQCLALVDKVAGTENVALMIEPASIKVGPSGLLSTGNFDFDRFDESCDTFSRSGSMSDAEQVRSMMDEEMSRKGGETELGAELEGGLAGPTPLTSQSYWIKIALSNVVPLTSMRKILTLFKHRDIDVLRMHLDGLEYVADPECDYSRSDVDDQGTTSSPTSSSGSNSGVTGMGETGITMVRMLVSMPDEASDRDALADLVREVKRLKWVDDQTLSLAYRALPGSRANESVGSANERQEVGVMRAEVITALVSVLHSLLSKQDPFAFSKTNINNVFSQPRHLRHAVGVADLFQERFNPEQALPDARYHAWVRTLRSDIEADVQEDMVAKEVLHRMVSLVEATLRTNFFLNERYALSFRFAPHVFAPGAFKQPYFDPGALEDTGGSNFTEIESVGAGEANHHSSAASSSSSGAADLASNALSSSSSSPLSSGDEDKVPFGVFFVHGRRFNGFHCRFRDIARGGMRLVTPPNPEQLAIESARHFDECYRLAEAQQAKNKDIPEGGSKCVLLIDTNVLRSEAERDLVMRKSVKAFTDAMLDLIVDTEETREQIVDYYGEQELVYLGPDEQVIPEDINWIVKRAGERGCPIPSAFMSSKPDAGINHKVYGVTSEGVQVFLDVALREMGMHPLDSPRSDGTSDGHFTVKMTGGPDGDVAGNMIKILHREYGDACRIVGLADATGCAEDREGLNMLELLRLVENELPIAAFDATKLSDDSGSRLSICDERFLVTGVEGIHGTDRDATQADYAHKTNFANTSESALEAALRARNTMHNRVVADAFIPAGGRPSTVHEGNWRQFLQPSTGEPSAKLVVEGANLFITDGAREALFRECGLPIVKDSSANKCGVICSSYEINCSMLLDETEFINEKERIVGDVLQRLRSRAQSEAELLFREFRNLPGALPHFSKRISNAINTLTDAIAACLPDQYSFESAAETGSDVEEDFGDDEHEYISGSVGAAAAGELRAAENAAVRTNAPRHLDDLLHLVHENLPEKVVEMGGHRLCEKVPKAYMKYAIASTLASKLVYQEGVEFVEKHKSDERLAALAFDFLEAEGAVAGLVDLMERLDWMELDNEDDAGVGAEDGAGQAFDRNHAKETAMKIVRRGGVRAYLAENRYTK